MWRHESALRCDKRGRAIHGAIVHTFRPLCQYFETVWRVLYHVQGPPLVEARTLGFTRKSLHVPALLPKVKWQHTPLANKSSRRNYGNLAKSHLTPYPPTSTISWNFNPLLDFLVNLPSWYMIAAQARQKVYILPKSVEPLLERARTPAKAPKWCQIRSWKHQRVSEMYKFFCISGFRWT